MYPLHRTALELLAARWMPALTIDGVHQSTIRCLPWDIDGFGELNNGRTLTLYDIPRFGFLQRCGFFRVVRQNGWGLTIAGVSVRFRRRVTVFQKLDTVTRLLGYDARFFYMDQSLWHRDHATSAALVRIAIVKPPGVDGSGGILPTKTFLDASGSRDWRPSLPEWAAAWVDAEAQRPWPPEGPR